MFTSTDLYPADVLAPDVADDEACLGIAASPAILTHRGSSRAGRSKGFDFFEIPDPKRSRLGGDSPCCGLPTLPPPAAEPRVVEPLAQPDINDIWDKVPRDVWGLILEKAEKTAAASLASVRRGPQESFADPAAWHQQWHFFYKNIKISWGENKTAPLEFFREPRNQAILSFTPSVALGGPKWLRPDLPELYTILAIGTPSLKRLSLHMCYHLSPRDHHPITRLTRLTCLEIPGTARHLDDDLMSAIGTMTGLRSLELKNESRNYYRSDDFINPDHARRSVITVAGVAGLQGLTNLDRLSLSGHFLPASCTQLLLGFKSLRVLGAFHWQGFTAHQVQNLFHQMPSLSWFMFSMLFTEKGDPFNLWYAPVTMRDRKLAWHGTPYGDYGMQVSDIKKTKLSLDNVEAGDDPSLADRMSACPVCQ
jgi:hypothetical protein